MKSGCYIHFLFTSSSDIPVLFLNFAILFVRTLFRLLLKLTMNEN